MCAARRQAGLGWPLPADLDEVALQARLYRREVPLSRAPPPNFAKLQSELKRPGMTRLLLWQEYKAATPSGWQYSVFCDQYWRWLSLQDLVLRQHHQPGDKCFVDYAGQTMGVIDRATGEVREAQIFIAALGASSYTYAEATWTQQLSDWLGSHVRAVKRGVFSTHGEHRPERHAAVVGLTHDRLKEHAALVGPCTVEVMERQRAAREPGNFALRQRDFSPEQLEAAARRALALQVYSYRAIRALITAKTSEPREP